ncbi:hypothetical protein FNV43_RR01555 [Rhamnella rubrinervis]|uniref:Pentatricopeptide repeat-containing protein n=1 Tax=Rhamnella rubrinervis TaxID=2594499 RepID=A0A8K0HPU4_9ROSA|nr:hypothetical protein FNV43_RR01555 [Rhamnella rubrinervis]
MYSDLVTPLNLTIASLLKALARQTKVKDGEAIYGFSLKCCFGFVLVVQNAVVDLLMRCEKLGTARRVFDEMEENDDVSWNPMMSGCASNRRVDIARELYDSMPKSDILDEHDFWEQDIRPDETFILAIISACSQLGVLDTGESIIGDCAGTLTCSSLQLVTSLIDVLKSANIKPDGESFLGVLSACNHGGLVNEGWDYYKQMKYGIHPSQRHYTCVADLLACRVHCNVQIGEVAPSKLFKIEPGNSGNYILLSNIYAAAGRWDGVSKVRAMIREQRCGQVTSLLGDHDIKVDLLMPGLRGIKE